MKPQNFQEFIFSLCQYWVNYGCIWSQPYDSQMGAGTFHPHTFLRGLGPEPWKSVYVQPCRRPNDGRYGKSPYRFQHYYQLQVLLKPSPSNIIDVFLKSLEHVGINLKENDIGLLEDDWKGPTLGAWGLGWEVRANAQEVTQFTYFQQLGGLDIDVVCGEITYGLERLYMYANGIKNGLDIPFNNHFTWGDIYLQNEFEFSHFNFKEANVPELFTYFEKCEEKVSFLCEKDLVLPAYDYVLQASHTFNLLDARGAISVSERQRYIGRVRDCAKKCAAKYKEGREKLGFPLLNKLDTDARNPIIPLNPSLISTQPDETAKVTSEIYNETKDFSDKKPVDVVIELGVEEMPPSFQVNALREITEKYHTFLSQNKEKFQAQHTFLEQLTAIEETINISARRLSLQLKNVPIWEPEQNMELWGPAERIAKTPDGKLSPAGLGFCKKNNINPEEASFKEKQDGKFLYYSKKVPGRNFISLLALEFKNWVYSLSAPLKMKWLPAEISPSFIRPVRSILALADNKVIPISMFGLESSNFTYGQRILSPGKVFISHASEYEAALKKLNIEINFEKRRSLILQEATNLAKKAGGHLIEDEGLLNKCAGLFESPCIFSAQFEEKYLRLPSNLITTVLKEHMNYFTVLNAEKTALIPVYIGSANYKCSHLEEMIEGTKGVVTGRLDDGTFYFDTDLSTPIEEMREKLKLQTFQENMGTLFDKTERLTKLADSVFEKLLSKKDNPFFGMTDKDILKTAAKYCKADLKSGCVLEFPDEMQGIMGGILAKNQNILGSQDKSNEVAAAIEQHYLPSGAQTKLPDNANALVLSLIDKLDSLCYMIHSGMEPKGNKDPLGMRRLALSILRTIGLKQEEQALALDLDALIRICIDNFKHFHVEMSSATYEKICGFFLDRIKSSLKEEFDSRAVESLSQKLLTQPIPKTIRFIQVIHQHIHDPKYSLLESLNPYRRARNLTLNSEHTIKVTPSLLTHAVEKELYESIHSQKTALQQFIQNEDFSMVLNTLENLKEPLAKFFENVMVNDENIQVKENRYALLLEVRSLYENIADFSLLQVS